ncbi:MAG: hypothetical protein NC930_09135 [Candidatus Omnitrophica bacterium]|nr:hypothetical protein [Candidatus Omnitrophota bacterium]
MTMHKAFFIMILSLLNFIPFLPSASAGEGTAGDYAVEISTKFGRGLENVITSPMEIPCTIGDELADHPQWGFLSGLGKGTVFMLRRILVGVTEVGTFVIPMERTIPRVCQEASTSTAGVQ